MEYTSGYVMTYEKKCIGIKLMKRTCIANGKKSHSILQQYTGRKCATIIAAVLWRHPSHRPCLFDVRKCNIVFMHYKHKKYLLTPVY